jgi:hypothetical protein
MTKRRFMLAIMASALALLVSAASMTGALAGQARPAPFCGGTGAIPAADLASAVSLNNCPIQGRLVVRSDGGSQMGVHVPPPGHAEVAVATTKSGDYVLSVTNRSGHVTATTAFPTVQAGRLPSIAKATDPACNELGVAYLGFVWNKTLKWYYNQSTASRAGLNGPTTQTAIRAANSNMTNGVNNCGYREGVFGSYIGGVPLGAYQGTTAKYANINSSAQCTSKFPDGQNTVSWGPFNSAEADTLALTCFEYDTGGNNFAIEADTYLGSNRGLVTSFSPFCTNKYDLETVMTHEWGHAYGLDHETSGPDEVMYTFTTACALRRHLGQGDYEGMANLYGVK